MHARTKMNMEEQEQTKTRRSSDNKAMQEGGSCTGRDTTNKAMVSILRTWLVKTSPLTANPSGSTTLEAKGRTRLVMGQTMAVRLAW